MQKVVGSNPISRSSRRPRSGGAFSHSALEMRSLQTASQSPGRALAKPAFARDPSTAHRPHDEAAPSLLGDVDARRRLRPQRCGSDESASKHSGVRYRPRFGDTSERGDGAGMNRSPGACCRPKRRRRIPEPCRARDERRSAHPRVWTERRSAPSLAHGCLSHRGAGSERPQLRRSLTWTRLPRSSPASRYIDGTTGTAGYPRRAPWGTRTRRGQRRPAATTAAAHGAQQIWLPGRYDVAFDPRGDGRDLLDRLRPGRGK